MNSWDVRTIGGRFIGRYSAAKAEIALQIGLELRGVTVHAREIEAKEIEPNVCELKYRGEVYIATGTR